MNDKTDYIIAMKKLELFTIILHFGDYETLDDAMAEVDRIMRWAFAKNSKQSNLH